RVRAARQLRSPLRISPIPLHSLLPYTTLFRSNDPGLNVRLTFDMTENVAAPFIAGARPKVAILREQGANGHVEMAAVFHRAGFRSEEHTSELQSRENLVCRPLLEKEKVGPHPP